MEDPEKVWRGREALEYYPLLGAHDLLKRKRQSHMNCLFCGRGET
jgi:hypothetical protein